MSTSGIFPKSNTKDRENNDRQETSQRHGAQAVELLNSTGIADSPSPKAGSKACTHTHTHTHTHSLRQDEKGAHRLRAAVTGITVHRLEARARRVLAVVVHKVRGNADKANGADCNARLGTAREGAVMRGRRRRRGLQTTQNGRRAARGLVLAHINARPTDKCPARGGALDVTPRSTAPLREAETATARPQDDKSRRGCTGQVRARQTPEVAGGR